MEQPTTIDLSGRKGVTLIVRYENVHSPFAVYVTDPTGREVFYYRRFDKDKLTLNLPKHSDQVVLRHLGDVKVKEVVIAPLKKPKLKYQFNKALVVKRPYPITAIRYQRMFNLPNGTPARFLYDRGVMQVDQGRMALLPQPVRQFIHSHELGHYYYGRPVPMKIPPELKDYYARQIEEDELECDRFALYHYLNDGYNFSTAFNSLFDHLSPSGMNVNRIVSIFGDIERLHKLRRE